MLWGRKAHRIGPELVRLRDFPVCFDELPVTVRVQGYGVWDLASRV